MENLTLRRWFRQHTKATNLGSESFPIKKITLLVSAITIFALTPSAFAEQHNFTNTLPNYLEIERDDIIFLENFTNSTILIQHTGGVFSTSLGVNGTWTGNFPYEVGIYEWVRTNGEDIRGTIVIKEKQLTEVSSRNNHCTTEGVI